jgi:hypothetical protein
VLILVYHKPKKREYLITHNNDSNLLAEAMEHVIENGLDGLSDAVTILLNEVRSFLVSVIFSSHQ